MSIATWRAEFYPEEAVITAAGVRQRGAPAAQQQLTAALASLRKWEGFRPEAMKIHGVRWRPVAPFILKDKGGTEWENPVTMVHCTLCQVSRTSSGACGHCEVCALAPYTDRCSDDYGMAPYGVFLETVDPEDMIEALQKAVADAREAAILEEEGDQ